MVGKKHFRNAAAVLVAGVLAVALVPGCGSSQTASTQQGGTGEATVSTAASGRQAKDAFDTSAKTTLTVGGVDFQVPDYFEKNSNDSDSNASTFTAESGDTVAMIQGVEGDGASATAEQISEKKQDIIDAWIDDMSDGDYENLTSSDVNDTTVAGMPGFTFTIDGTYSGTDLAMHGVWFFNYDGDLTGRVLLAQSGNSKYDYTSDFDKILASATVSQAASSSKSSEEKASKSSKKKFSKSQVTPKFKKTMDSYEKFFKKYAKFMKKYKKNPTDMSILSDYASMMSEYSDMYSSYQEIDTDDLSSADLAYYTKVNARILKILADVM